MPRRHVPSRLALVLVPALLAGSAACTSGDSSNGVTAPTVPKPTLTATVENFTGTVAVGGTDIHPFTVINNNGDLTVTLTAAGPPPTIPMGLGVGTPSGALCTLMTSATAVVTAGTVAQLTGAAAAGSYCVEVFDVGNQTNDITYAVTVSHY